MTDEGDLYPNVHFQGFKIAIGHSCPKIRLTGGFAARSNIGGLLIMSKEV